jgi:hypothetical protein
VITDLEAMVVNISVPSFKEEVEEDVIEGEEALESEEKPEKEED